MSNLIAYIPVVNQRHITWLEKYASVGTQLFLISQEMAVELVPRLARNIGALPAETIARFIGTQRLIRMLAVFAPEHNDPRLGPGHAWREWVMPDEDVSHELAAKYLVPAGCTVRFENIWARYDMQVVRAQEPIIPDMELSEHEFDRTIMRHLKGVAHQSPDWWRQVAATAVDTRGEPVMATFNQHLPTEYVTDILGDPAINRDAGEKGRSLGPHAEASLIARCAREGITLEGGFIYVTTFPCETCAYSIAEAGLSKVFFRDGYSAVGVARETLRTARIQVIRVV